MTSISPPSCNALYSSRYVSRGTHPRRPETVSRPRRVSMIASESSAERTRYRSTHYDRTPEYRLAMDDGFSHVRLRADERQIKAEVQRALVVQKRARARRAAKMVGRASVGPQSAPNTRLIAQSLSCPQNSIGPDYSLKACPSTQYASGNQPASGFSSPGRRLAPLSRFNPFVRTRAESLSSIIDGDEYTPFHQAMNEKTTWRKKLRRATTIGDIFTKRQPKGIWV